MKIRRATASDAAALAALNRDVQGMHALAWPNRFRRDASDEVVGLAFRAMIEAPASFWLVVEDERLMGYLSAEFRTREESWCVKPHQVCYVAAMVVAPEDRRQGIGRALLEELQREADARGVTEIELDVWAFNAEARRAFARLGFEPLMERMRLGTRRANVAPDQSR